MLHGLSVMDPGGSRCPLLRDPILSFSHNFHQKVPASDIGALQQEILDPPLIIVLLVSGGSRISRWGGTSTHWEHQPLMQALFGKNVCENKRIGSRLGGHTSDTPSGSTNASCLHTQFNSVMNG